MHNSHTSFERRIFLYCAGCVIFSIGAKLFINSKLGVDPLDTLVIGLSSKLNCKIGTASGLVAFFFLLVWSVWNKRKPLWTPFLTMVFVGYLIDLWNYISPVSMAPAKMSESYSIMLAGLLVCAYASSLIIMSGIGIRTMDLVALTIFEKLKLPFFFAKGLIEFMFIAIGFLLGGPYGVATIAFLLLVGPLIQPMAKFNHRVFGFVNYGMSKSSSSLV